MTSKINLVLQEWPNRTVATARWLQSKGVDHRLADQYVRSGWLNRLGHGAYTRPGSNVDWPGGVNALQTQLGLDIHLGARTALEMHGYAHYLAFHGREVFLFGNTGSRLPSWFVRNQWSQSVTLVRSGAFQDSPANASILEVDGIELNSAYLELAALEMIYLVPNRQDYEEAERIMESLNILRPQIVQHLLERCSSVKTKRLFMHVAERCSLPWVSKVDLSKVDFGSGRRSIHIGGKLSAKYNLVVADQD